MFDDAAWAVNSAVECYPHTVEVRGSNPLPPTITAEHFPPWSFYLKIEVSFNETYFLHPPPIHLHSGVEMDWLLNPGRWPGLGWIAPSGLNSLFKSRGIFMSWRELRPGPNGGGSPQAVSGSQSNRPSQLLLRSGAGPPNCQPIKHAGWSDTSWARVRATRPRKP